MQECRSLSWAAATSTRLFADKLIAGLMRTPDCTLQLIPGLFEEYNRSKQSEYTQHCVSWLCCHAEEVRFYLHSRLHINTVASIVTPGLPGCCQLSMPQLAHSSLQLVFHLSLPDSPLVPRCKGSKLRSVGQALQGGADLGLVSCMLHSILSPASESSKQSLVCQSADCLLEGCSVVVPSVAGVLPGVKGPQQGGIGELG